MSNFISIRNLHLYPLTQDDASGLVYGDSIKVPGLVKVDITPSMASGTYYADGIAYEQIQKFSGAEIVVQASTMDLETQATICGHTYNRENKTIICKADDVPPAFGMKYERVKADGTSRFIAINKVTFSLQAENGQTASDSIEFQDTGDLSAQAVPTIHNGEWKSMYEGVENASTFFAEMISED